MLLGKLPVGMGAPTRLVASSPKTPPYVPTSSQPDDLSEVAVTVHKIETPPPVSDQAPEDLPEITVSAPRIPWWMWSIAGVAGYLLLANVLGGKSREGK